MANLSTSASVCPLHSTLAECSIHSRTVTEFLTEQCRYLASDPTPGRPVSSTWGHPGCLGILRASLPVRDVTPSHGKSPVFECLEAHRSRYIHHPNICSNGMVPSFRRNIEDGRHVTSEGMFEIDVTSPWWPRFGNT